MEHKSVLMVEVMQFLDPKPGKTFIDATLNGGGHTSEMSRLMKGKGTILGIERDPEIVKIIKKKDIPGLVVEEGNYTNMAEFVRRHKLEKIDGILFDLGLSSWHLDESGRGFTFRDNEPLDMRFSPKEKGQTAAELVNSLPEVELADIFHKYGEERESRKYARAIVKARKEKRIVTTGQLAEVIERSSRKTWRTRIHPATRVFQALRIAVNEELESVRLGIEAAMELVRPGGVVVAISFHSLEDRIVKNAFRARGEVLTKKIVTPSAGELADNPRSRSSKLRAWKKS
ncbi:MAG: 16S rRNA (cytosine(1402)-N(4))-methyltransferase RsmH [bacterium]|nr:16S rRNA (cytosine(1402)-N(4))-methyltransferase RsmH [bacterium]